MASVASQLLEEVTEHGQSDSLEDAQEICADGTYFPNNLRRLFRVCFEYTNEEEIVASSFQDPSRCSLIGGHVEE